MILSDEVLRGLLEAAPDAIVAVDASGSIVFANQQTEDLFGWPRDALVGGSIEQLIPERYALGHPDLRAGYLRAPATRPMGATTALSARRRDGTELPVEISLSAIDTDDGVLVAAAIRDVSRSRLAEQKFRGLLASAPDAIVGVDGDGRVELMNEQAERLFGWPSEELIGQPIEALVPVGAVGRHVAHRRAYGHDPVSRPMGLGLRLSARRRDGSEFPAEISLSTIESSEGPRTVLAAVRDVTDRLEFERARQRQALEAQREQSHRLESIGQLAGGVAHDFNNLLGVILNYATLVERSVEDQVVLDDLAQIRGAAERAAELTRQLLSFARRDVVSPTELDVGDLIARFTQMLARTLGEHIELVVEPPEEPITITADRHQIEQVLLNLCLNARDAMPRGGVLALRCRSETVVRGSTEVSLALGDYVVLSVVDEGTGMSPEVVERAFEPFFTTKAAGEGTGLGLATVYGVVHQNGGEVRLDSQVGVGTTVSVYLPRVEGPVEARGSDLRERELGELILVVEDETGLRNVVARMLRERGYRVLVAEDGRDARKVIDRSDEPIDLLLTDVVMPGVSGPELVSELRTGQAGPVKVLYMSGYAPTSGDVEGERMLPKPFTEEELFAAVREVLHG